MQQKTEKDALNESVSESDQCCGTGGGCCATAKDAPEQCSTKEETTTIIQDEHALEHCYYEVTNDLLSKPNALVDIIQSEGNPPTVVFCNSPSEADFVEVMLKKHAIAAAKLIGHVPFGRVAGAAAQARDGELTALVVTDVSARELDVRNFQVIVNYSVHEDPEIYIHRISPENGIGSLKKVVSIISPLDFGNFHYLKKILQYNFVKAEPPSKDKIYEAQAQKFIKEALDGAHLKDERTQKIVETVLHSEHRDAVLALFCHKTLNAALAPSAQPDQSRDDERPARDDGFRDGGRRDRRGSDRGRGDRGRDYRREGYDRSDREYPERDRFERDNRDNYEGDRRDSAEAPRYERREYTPPKRDVRLYLGHGKTQGFSEAELAKLTEAACGLGADQLKRFSLRDYYSFVDIAEEQAEAVLSGLQSAKREDGTAVFARKATVLTATREQSDDGDPAPKNDNGNDGDFEGEEAVEAGQSIEE